MRMKMDIELHRSYKKSKINELATYKKVAEEIIGPCRNVEGCQYTLFLAYTTYEVD